MPAHFILGRCAPTGTVAGSREGWGERMDRIKYGMLGQEFPALRSIEEFEKWDVNCSVHIKKADLDFLKVVPKSEKHDTSCFTAYKNQRVYFVSEDGDIKRDAVNPSKSFVSHVNGTPSRESEGETIGDALINYPVDVLEFVIVATEEYDDSLNEVIDSKEITIYKGNWKQLQSNYEREMIEKAQKELRDEYLKSATEFGKDGNGYWIRCLNGARYTVTEEEMVYHMAMKDVIEALENEIRAFGTIDLTYYETYPSGASSRRNAIYTFKDGFWWSDKKDAEVDRKSQMKIVDFMNGNADFFERKILAKRYLLELLESKKSVKA